MEKQSLIEAMKISISEVLGKMSFLPVDFEDTSNSEKPSLPENNGKLITKLSLKGPFNGFFLFYIPKDLALFITASFLGKTEEDIAQDQIPGTVMEITNMIAGNTFSVYNEHLVFNLNIPVIVCCEELEDIPWRSVEKVSIVVNTLKDNCLIFNLVITETA